MSSLHNFLAEFGSILLDIIQLCIFIKVKIISEAKRIKNLWLVFKNNASFCLNRCFKG